MAVVAKYQLVFGSNYNLQVGPKGSSSGKRQLRFDLPTGTVFDNDHPLLLQYSVGRVISQRQGSQVHFQVSVNGKPLAVERFDDRATRGLVTAVIHRQSVGPALKIPGRNTVEFRIVGSTRPLSRESGSRLSFGRVILWYQLDIPADD